MSQPQWPGDPFAVPQRTGLGLGAGAALGLLIGLTGPVVLALIAWGGIVVLPPDAGGTVVGLSIIAILALPILLLIAGCVLMVGDDLRGWGVAGLTASGIWLISSAGVCTVWIFGSLATYDNASAMMIL